MGQLTSFEDLYNLQKQFQTIVLNSTNNNTGDLPQDNVNFFRYFSLALIEEMGEVLKTDGRWKLYRKSDCSQDEKLEEIADVFLMWCNVALFSGFDSGMLLAAILNKISVNHERIKNADFGNSDK